MATYSVWDLNIENELSFEPGPTAGWILAIDSNGEAYWKENN